MHACNQQLSPSLSHNFPPHFTYWHLPCRKFVRGLLAEQVKRKIFGCFALPPPRSRRDGAPLTPAYGRKLYEALVDAKLIEAGASATLDGISRQFYFDNRDSTGQKWPSEKYAFVLLESLATIVPLRSKE